MKKNCWVHKKCERQPGGAKVNDLGICPACTNTVLEGVHDGKKGGRACWIIAGTYCEGEKQGSFASKLDSCSKCDFYKQVRVEEAESYMSHRDLLKKLTG